MTTRYFLEWMKALGVPFLTAVVSGASVLVVTVFSWWQVRIAREKLRHDLYGLRFAIYMAFHELLVAVSEKNDVDLELRKANAARAHSPFLLDAQLGAYLEALHAEAFSLNAANNLVRDPSASSPAERAQKASQLGTDKLAFANKVTELVQEFGRFLKLKDFSKHGRRKR
jgi:hypothetical protein